MAAIPNAVGAGRPHPEDDDGLLYRQSTGPDGLERLARAWAKPGRWGFFTEPNNTWIGLLYIGTAFLFFLAAGVLALLMRIQLAIPNNTFLDPATYNQFFTMHGTVMMFLFAVPIGEAFAMLLLPSMLGSRDMPFPLAVGLRLLVLRDRRRARPLQPVLRHRARWRLVHVSTAHGPDLLAGREHGRLDPRARIRRDLRGGCRG